MRNMLAAFPESKISMTRVLLCFINPRVRKIRNEASSCPGIFSRTLRLYTYMSNVGWRRSIGCLEAVFKKIKISQKIQGGVEA